MNPKQNSTDPELLAPIVLFCYNRPKHLATVLDNLSRNPEAARSTLYIFCDGPKAEISQESLAAIKDVHTVVEAESRFNEVVITKREKNIGLANSVISGVSQVVEKHGKVIVLEDDIVPSIGFLKFMNEALDLYEDDEKVGCIHAWNYELDLEKYSETTFFLKGADCWGWATWKRAWALFNPDGNKLLKEIQDRHLEFAVNRRDTYPFMTMLKDQISGRVDSWAIRWHASLYVEDRYCLYPTRPIVMNIGFDNSGTHCGYFNVAQNPVDYIQLSKLPVKEESWYFEAFKKHEKLQANESTLKKIVNWAKRKCKAVLGGLRANQDS